MSRYRYSWREGIKSDPLMDIETLMDSLSDSLFETHSLDYAMEQLKYGGFEDLKGLKKLLEKLVEERKALLDKYDMDSLVDEQKEQVKDAVSKEHEAAQQMPRSPSNARRKDWLKDVQKSGLREMLDRLGGETFTDPEAQKLLEEIMKLRLELTRLELMAQRYPFRGKDVPDMDEAMYVYRKLDELSGLENSIRRGDLSKISEDAVVDLLGRESLKDLQSLKAMEGYLKEAGFLEERGGHLGLTPRAIRRIAMKALSDIFFDIKRDRTGDHDLVNRGAAVPRLESTRKHRFGDPFNIDLSGSLFNTIKREGSRVPVRMRASDFEVYELDHTTTTSTALLIDMSWSMSWEGKFGAAKKVALALHHLIHTKYPRDRLHIIGFYTVAREIQPHELPELTWNTADPFTNIQAALIAADRLLSRHAADNKEVIVITDGQPTAFHQDGMLKVEWPVFGVSPGAGHATMEEVYRLTKKGVTINVFMLDDDPSLKSFVDDMTRINRGRAFYSTPASLGKYLLVDYIAKHRKIVRPS